jgi:hypothetical protein
MWLATKHGFFSIVRKGDAFHVRARIRKDLLSLVEATGGSFGAERISESPSADYRWRIVASAQEMQVMWAALSSSVDYPNFKSEIAAEPGQRDKLSIYHEIWHLLHEYQRKADRV